MFDNYRVQDQEDAEAEAYAKEVERWNSLAEDHQRLLGEVESKDKALLLAARWFKLNFDDETLNEHPPSKADLAGMFDAMQEARLNPTRDRDTA